MTIRNAIIAEPPSRSEVAAEEALPTHRQNYPLAELL